MNRYRPAYEEFVRQLGSASCIPVYRQLTGDGLTPVSAFARIERSAPSFLFESVIGGEKVGRFSFLGTEPFLHFEARGCEVTIVDPRDRRSGSPVQLDRSVPRSPGPGRALSIGSVERAAAVRRRGGRLRVVRRGALHRELAGDASAMIAGLPDLSFAFYDRMVIFDHIRKTILVVAQAHVGPGADPEAAYAAACAGIDELVQRLAAQGPDLGLRDIDTESPVTLRASVELHARRVRSGRSPLPGVHQGRRYLSGRSQPAIRDRDEGRPVRYLPRAAGGQSQPVSLLPALSATLP